MLVWLCNQFWGWTLRMELLLPMWSWHSSTPCLNFWIHFRASRNRRNRTRQKTLRCHISWPTQSPPRFIARRISFVTSVHLVEARVFLCMATQAPYITKQHVTETFTNVKSILWLSPLPCTLSKNTSLMTNFTCFWSWLQMVVLDASRHTDTFCVWS